ncbi:MAG: hypothetical protein AAGD32_06015 [Planctomycetota bacterium]
MQQFRLHPMTSASSKPALLDRTDPRLAFAAQPVLENLERRQMLSANTADVVTLTLVNADTDQDVVTVAAGQDIDLAAFDTDNFNIRADVPDGVEGVLFDIDGEPTRFEKVEPFALAGDRNGDYYNWTPSLGTLRIGVTMYGGDVNGQRVEIPVTFVETTTVAPVQNLTAQPNADGVVLNWSLPEGDAFEDLERINVLRSTDNGVTFTQVAALDANTTQWLDAAVQPASAYVYVVTASDGQGNTSTPATVSVVTGMSDDGTGLDVELYLVDARTNQDIYQLADGSVIDLSTLNTDSLNIYTNVANATGVELVLDHLDGDNDYRRFEQVAPYALFGDRNGDFYGATLEPGDYQLTLNVYDGSAVVATHKMAFAVVAQAVQPPAPLPPTPPPAGPPAPAPAPAPAVAGISAEVIELDDGVTVVATPENADDIEGVVFSVNGVDVRIERAAPYALGGDTGGDLRPWDMPAGSYEVTASLLYADGSRGASVTVTVMIEIDEQDTPTAMPDTVPPADPTTGPGTNDGDPTDGEITAAPAVNDPSRPGPNNTGPTDVDALVVHNGQLIIDRPGVYENIHVIGGDASFAIIISADNDNFGPGDTVVLRNFKVEGGKYGNIRIYADTNNVTLEDGELVGRGEGSTGVTGSAYTARRLNIFAGNDGFRVFGEGPYLIENNWVHNLSGSHTDAIQAYPSAFNVHVRGNHFQGGQNTAVINGINTGWVVEGNWIYGSMFALHVAPAEFYGDEAQPIIRFNRIDDFVGGAQRWGDIGQFVWEGNVDDDGNEVLPE